MKGFVCSFYFAMVISYDYAIFIIWKIMFKVINGEKRLKYSIDVYFSDIYEIFF